MKPFSRLNYPKLERYLFSERLAIDVGSNSSKKKEKRIFMLHYTDVDLPLHYNGLFNVNRKGYFSLSIQLLYS